jgi:hypothetical protein
LDLKPDRWTRIDAPVLVWKASTQTMNPSVSRSVIDEAYERDPAAAAAEYGAEFRTDVEGFVSREVVEACVVTGRYELPPIGGMVYSAFTDPSGGSADSMTIAISHRDGEKVILDVVREIKPPFSPEQIVADFALLLKSYRVTTVAADRYAGEWVKERFRAHGIECIQGTKPKSDLYKDLLPVLNSGCVELLDNPKAILQICSLERRTARGGRDSIDHAPGAHDDVANAIAGAVLGSTISRGGPEGWLEYYRRLNEQARVDPKNHGYRITPQAVQFAVPEGVSHVYLSDGTCMLVPPDRIVSVGNDDASALGRRGWKRVEI